MSRVSKVSKKKKIPGQQKRAVLKHRKKAGGKDRGILEISLMALFAGSIILLLALYMRG